MAELKAKADKESSSTEVKYSFFAGRWQPLHKGHLWLINERLKEGYNVWLGIRDVKPDEKNPWTAEEILEMVYEGELKELIPRHKTPWIWLAHTPYQRRSSIDFCLN